MLQSVNLEVLYQNLVTLSLRAKVFEARISQQNLTTKKNFNCKDVDTEEFVLHPVHSNNDK